MRYIIGAIRSSELPASVGAVIINNIDSDAFRWAESENLHPVLISGRTHSGADTEDEAILKCLLAAQTDFIILSGYMKKIGPKVLAEFEGRILNIHPALLPSFGGKGMYGDRVHKAVLEAGAAESGATVHLVDSQYDEGRILKQKKVAVEKGETVESLREKVKALEGPLYLEVLKEIVNAGGIPKDG